MTEMKEHILEAAHEILSSEVRYGDHKKTNVEGTRTVLTCARQAKEADGANPLRRRPDRDPRHRLAIQRRAHEERYPTHAGYVNRVRAAAQALQHDRVMLAEDVGRFVQTAEASSVGN